MTTLLTMKEVATVLQASKAHVCNLVNGKVAGCSPLPVLRLGRRLLIRQETLHAWIAQNERANATLVVTPERGRKSA